MLQHPQVVLGNKNLHGTTALFLPTRDGGEVCGGSSSPTTMVDSVETEEASELFSVLSFEEERLKSDLILAVMLPNGIVFING